ncbi:hypothetical protein ILUMI_19067, partial [Ignelater luminosus]
DPKDEFAQKVKESKEACIKDTNVKPDMAEKAMDGEFADDKDLKCFIKCMFVKFGYMTDAGDLNVDFMKEHPRPGDDKTKSSAAIDKCKSPAGSDACEKAYNFAKCAHPELKA